MWNGAVGETMRPGDTCQGCHTFNITGTVYPTGHEPTYCDGLGDQSVTVRVSDAAGRVIDVTPDTVGNFFYQGAITYPFTAKVMRGASERPMNTPQSNGECDTCHTATGLVGAPGRIVPPV
jgi:hypothetical protein